MTDEETLVVSHYTIHLDQLIGKGAFGKVYDCTDQNDKKKELCAKIITEKIDDEKTLREINLMEQLKDASRKNPNIVGIEMVKINPDNIVLILDKCECDLQKQLDDRKKEGQAFTPLEATNIIGQIINGYKVLFAENIIHRDMKPANILFKKGLYKIADFGLARVTDQMGKHTKVGTPKYAAPQLFFEPTFTSKADIFSIGIMFYELIFGRLPFKANNQQDIRKALKNLKDQPIIVDRSYQGMTQEIANVIEYMVKYSENERIKWEELFNHPLFSKGSNVQVNESQLFQDDEEEDEQVQTTAQIPLQQPVEQTPPTQTAQFQPLAKPAGFQPFQPSLIPQQQQQQQQQFQNKFTTQPQQTAKFGTPNNNFAKPFTPVAPGFPTQTGNTFQPPATNFQPATTFQAANTFQQASSFPIQSQTQGLQLQQTNNIADQLFQVGLFFSSGYDLIEKYMNIQMNINPDHMNARILFQQLSECFFEHTKQRKQQSSFGLYTLPQIEEEIKKQQATRLNLLQEISIMGLQNYCEVPNLTADYLGYLNRVFELLSNQAQLFYYANDKKYFFEYLQLIYLLEKLKEIRSQVGQFGAIYNQILQITINYKNEKTIRDYLRTKY